MSFVQLFDGGIVDCTGDRPKVVKITVHAIARQLSRIPRWCAATDEIFTVAQHSVMVCCVAQRLGLGAAACRYALLHDAVEIITSDMPGPIKRYGRIDKEVEESILVQIIRAVDGRCAISAYLLQYIDYIDKYVAMIEARLLFDRPDKRWDDVTARVARRTPREIITACLLYSDMVRYQDPSEIEQLYLNTWVKHGGAI